MANTDRPRTVDELFALPGVGFGSVDRLVNGTLIRVPVAPDIVSFWSEPADILMGVDAAGVRWKLAQLSTGHWCKLRVSL